METRGSLGLVTMRHDFGLIVINGPAVIVRMRSTVADLSPIHFRLVYGDCSLDQDSFHVCSE